MIRLLVITIVISQIFVHGYGKKTKCFAVPTFPMKVENVIKSCQNEVKMNLIDDLLFAAFHENPFDKSNHQHMLKDFEDHSFGTQVNSGYLHSENFPSHYVHHDPRHHHGENHHNAQLLLHQSPHVHHSDPSHTNFPHFYHQASSNIELHHNHAHPQTIYDTNPSISQFPNSHPHPHEAHYNSPVHHHYQLSHEPHSQYQHLPSTEFHQIVAADPQQYAQPEVEEDTPAPTTMKQIKVVEAHESLKQILADSKPAGSNDKHIATILEKIRSGTLEESLKGNEDTSDLLYHRRISKRSLFGNFWKSKQEDEKVEDYHPAVISHEDRWMAGCLMQCVFRKNNAVNTNGYPTLDGVVDLYTDGTSEQKLFMHVLRAVDKCLKGAAKKHNIHKGKVPLKGETCEVAFDVFDCVSDSVTEYCS